MIKITRNFSIRKEVFYLGLVSSITILLVFGILLIAGFFSISTESARKNIRETNQQISIFTDRFFSEIITTVDMLSGNDDIRNLMLRDDEASERALAIYRNVLAANEDILYVYSGYSDGLLLINDYVPPDGFDPAIRPWYLAALKSNPLAATGVPYLEANSGEWVIAPSRVLIDENGEISGVIAIDITLEGVISLLEKRHRYPSQRSFILDQNGVVLIHPDETVIGESLAVINDKIDSSQGQLDYNIDNQALWAYYNTIENTGWIFITDVERNEILAPMVLQVLSYFFLIIILAVFIGVLMSNIFSKRFAEPLIDLGNRIAAITSGEAPSKAPSSHSNYEISMIAENIEKLAEHSLNKKANELQTIIESTKDGILVINNQREVIYVNSRFKEMWHLTDDVIESKDEKRYIDAVYDQLEDPDLFFSGNEALYRSDQSETGELSFKDGRVFETYSTPLFDDKQVVARLWSFRDVTDRKDAEEQIVYQNEFLKLIADISADFVNTTIDNIDAKIENMFSLCGPFLEVDRIFLFQFSTNDEFVYCTHEWCARGIDSVKEDIQHFPVRSLRWVEQLVKTRKVFHVPDVEELPAEAEREKNELRRQGVKSLMALPLIKGRVFFGYFGFYSMRSSKNLSIDQVEVMQIMTNILADALINNNMEKELQQSNLDLARLSATDKLTQLYNRMKLDEVLEGELARVKRNGPTFTVIIIDIDHFKAVNDTYGHQPGDQILISFAEILRSNLRITDTYGRWGGEEFLVISPNSNIGKAVKTAEKLRVEIENYNFPSGIKITASFGIAVSSSDDSVSAIITRADRALYKAKGNGRNRVETS